MKKNLILIFFSIAAGILFTFFVLNKESIYAKEEYVVYAFQIGAFENLDNASNFKEKISSNINSIMIKDDNLYKIYGAIYKDIDLVNIMITFFENKNLNIYLKTINVNKKFYESLDNYERILKNTNDENIYNKVNESILNLYLESLDNNEIV